MTKERRLGRGLEALLGRPLDDNAPHDTHDGEHATPPSLDSLPQINVYEIDANPYQPRREFNETELNQLTESIKQHGMLQPITVRRIDNRFQLVAGERRLRAATKAGWHTVPAQVVDIDERQLIELAIVENLQRKDLNPIEKATSFQSYLDRYHCTQEELAGRLQIERSTMANLIRLLELPEEVQQAVRAGKLSAGHARALLPLGDEHEQRTLGSRIVDEGLSVRAVESEVQAIMKSTGDDTGFQVVAPTPNLQAPVPMRNLQLAALEQEFRIALGLKLDLKQSAQGRGKLTIHFASHEDFERLRERLLGPQRFQQAG